jgi:hypothetical protein|nr:hypothetical protein Q903MT_gene4635 [Picea sitchensis]
MAIFMRCIATFLALFQKNLFQSNYVLKKPSKFPLRFLPSVAIEMVIPSSRLANQLGEHE